MMPVAQARELRADLRSMADGERRAHVRQVGIKVALTVDGEVELNGGWIGSRSAGRHLPLGVLRHLAQPLASMVLDGAGRKPGQGARPS